MVAFLTLLNGEPFATGAATYIYHPATEQEILPRLILHIEIENVSTSVILAYGRCLCLNYVILWTVP